MSGGKGRNRPAPFYPAADDRLTLGPELRSNGLGSEAPNPDQRILVTGGAGYIGCVLVPRLLERGYRVRVLDRLYWGEEPLAGVPRTASSSWWPTCATPAERLDGVDGVIHLAGPLERPDGRVRPRGQLADERASRPRRSGGACVERGHRALRVRLVVLALRRPAAGHARRERRRSSRAAPTRPRSATARSGCSSWPTRASCPVILRNGTVYGWSPRMRFDLVVNTFVKDALLEGRLAPRRRLDVAPAGGRAATSPTR